MDTFSIPISVCSILLTLIGFLYAYRSIFAAVGVFRTKKFAPAKRFHRYAVVIAARNEEAVIGNLLDSIRRQDYPAELVTVFVVADNCTDQTAAVSRAHGAVCYERNDLAHCTKGFALQYLFEQIARDYGVRLFEGFFIFDADNLLKKDYISRMNDAFDSGEKIITSYRNTKNFDSSWISAGYALHWLRTARFENRARSALGVATRIQGTGFLFSSELAADGWKYTSLTEDRAFSADAVVQGFNISYQDAAEFYDEQPTSLSVAWRQRLRWSKGHVQAFMESGKSLFVNSLQGKTALRKFVSFDMLLTNLPGCIVTIPVKLLKLLFMAFSCIALDSFYSEWPELALAPFSLLLVEHIANIPLAAALFVLERKRVTPVKWYKKAFYCLMFPLFSIIGDVSTCVAVFRQVGWDAIPHSEAIRIEDLEPVGVCAPAYPDPSAHSRGAPELI